MRQNAIGFFLQIQLKEARWNDISTNTAPPRVQCWGCISLTTGGIFKLSTLNQPHGSVRYESGEKWMFSFWKNINFRENVKDYAQIWVRFESKSDYPIMGEQLRQVASTLETV